MTILPVTLPIIAENLLLYTFYLIDMAMLSAFRVGGIDYGDEAVAAVGAMGSFVFFINIFFNMVNLGSGIITTQHNGARQREEATGTVMNGIALSAGIGIAMSLSMCFLARPIVSVFGLNPVREGFAGDYLTMFGSFSFAVAMNTAFTTVLRSYGYTKIPMLINMAANLLNILGNAISIFGLFGLPQWGVAGVACSTVLSQGLAAAVMFIIILKKSEIGFTFRKFVLVKAKTVWKVLRIGLPSSGEFLAYNLASMVMIGFVAGMDAALPTASQVNLPAYNYAFILMRFIAQFSVSIGQGTQIITGYLVGAGQREEAYRKVIRYFLFSLLTVTVLAGAAAVFRFPLLGIFGMEPNVLSVAASLILVGVALETGRVWNLVIIGALKASGDVYFPVAVGSVSMWGLGVGGAFLFGVILKLGVIGIWMGIILDEWTRGVIMFFRWRSKIWQTKRIIAAPLAFESSLE